MKSHDTPLTVGSLFSGIGGIDLGLERAGMKVVWQCEIDPYCRRVLRCHWPMTWKFKDVKTILEDKQFRKLPGVDVIAGGFPCQDISNQGAKWGERKALNGDRSGLWHHMLGVVRVVRPKYVIVENVAELRNKGLDTLLGGLAGSGYDAWWDCIPACAFGAPHQRYRTFVVAYHPGKRMEGFTAPEIPRISHLPWFKDVRSVEDVRNRPDLPEPLIRRTDDGFSGRVDRLKALGNSVVPQIAEWIGRGIVG